MKSLPASEVSSLDSSGFTMTVFRPAPSPQVERNKWLDINPLPVQQIKKFLPKYELDLDASMHYSEATAMLLAKRAHAQAVQEAKDARKRELRDEQRKALALRHLATEEVECNQLEKKAGVIKFHSEPGTSVGSSQSSLGPFGFQRQTQCSPEAAAFAQPRSPFLPKDPLLYAEFRGLIARDNSEAARKMRTMFNSRTTTLSGSQLSIEDMAKTAKTSFPTSPRSPST